MPASSASVGPAPAGTATLTGAAATALVAKAVANTQAASSVRVAGKAAATVAGSTGTASTGTASTGTGAGTQMVTFDITLVKRAGCEGTIALSKTQTFKIVETAGYVWLLPTRAFYTSLHLSKAAVALVADKYIKVKSTDSQIGDLAKVCTFTGLLSSMSKPTGTAYAAAPVTYNGGPAYEVTQSGKQGTAFVSNTAKPLLLKITDQRATGGTITFTDYNATATITAPTAAESIDGSQLGV
jgi:hypothetical protein